MSLAEKLGLPGRIVVRRSDVAEAFAGLADRLEVILAPDIDAFHQFRDSLAQGFPGA